MLSWATHLCFMLIPAVAHAAGPMPKLGEANIFPFSDLTKELHHCQFWASVSPSAQANADFNMLVAPALNGAADAISLHAATYPTHYLSVSGASSSGDLQFVDGVASGSAVGKAAASWQIVPALAAGAPGALYSLRSMSTGSASGAYLSLATNSTAPCLKGDPASFDVIADKTPADPKAATWAIGEKPPAPPARVEVDAGVVTNPAVNKRWMGCHSDYGFAQTPRGFLANLIYGAAFGNRSCAWSKPGVGSCDVVPDWQQRVAVGTSATVAMSSFAAFATKPSMQINVQTPPKGSTPTLSAGIVNRGIGGMGFALEGGKPYDVEIWIWRASDATMFAELRDFSPSPQRQDSDTASGGRNDAEGKLLARHEWNVTSTGPPWGATWERVNFTLTPSAGTVCVGLTPGTDPAVDCSGAQPGTPHVCIRCGGEIVIGMSTFSAQELF